MPNRPKPSRPAFAAPLLLCLALLTAVLAPAPDALAQAQKTPCARSKPASHRSKCPQHGAKGGRRGSSKGSHRHPAKSRGAAHAVKTHARNAPAAPLLTPAVCADESEPLRASNGTFSCDDGSQPGCEDESSPIREHHSLACVVTAPPAGESNCPEEGAGSFCLTGSSGSGEPVCEDGSTPIASGEGTPICDDGSEPACEDGSAPLETGDGTFSCEGGPAPSARRRALADAAAPPPAPEAQSAPGASSSS